MLTRAKFLFQALDEREAQVIVPTVALSEYLRPYEPSEHAGQIAAMEERFLIMPFDAKCVAIAARVFNNGRAMRKSGVEGERNALNADSMIIATALAYGAQEIYSNDKKFRRLAEGASKAWQVKDLPMMGPHLFSETNDA